MEERRIISVTVLNEHGALSRIAQLFSGRGYNIESLTVAPLPMEEGRSKLTIVTTGDSKVLEQIEKQLNKLIPVFKVSQKEMVTKEVAIIKFPISARIADIEALCRAHNGIIDTVSEEWVIAIITEAPNRVDDFIKVAKNFSPKEIIRSGSVSIDKD